MSRCCLSMILTMEASHWSNQAKCSALIKVKTSINHKDEKSSLNTKEQYSSAYYSSCTLKINAHLIF